ncbi:hypothetical protein STCU_01044 [Strigomonas culicis]|uniref:C2H2-type domain-containing protein n=1 Tax=Strigomonas culicis TaxID=28005 RepID=S9UPC4_9TRYP|nr:hypothetical protein STCU_02700 [Strigomonas culicis]EPY35630.1 hypothetical protein STCU_01044 [Strigomonas culicis]|eukprot:EPY32737.1 hypothetical protein STCU_02700 [Strigomonas culicis]
MRSAAVALHLSGLEEPISVVTHASQDCGPIACSYRTEACAMLVAFEDVILPYVEDVELTEAAEEVADANRSRRVLIVTDSLSLVEALQTGLLTQTSTKEIEICQCLYTLCELKWKVHFQFVYAHCGIQANELADEVAAETMEGRMTYTREESAPIWQVDIYNALTRLLRRRWCARMWSGTHRYELCGTRKSDISGIDLITKQPLTRRELVQLARVRCGETPLFGRLFWAVRFCPNNCRFCNRTAEQDAALRQPFTIEDRALAEAGTSTTILEWGNTRDEMNGNNNNQDDAVVGSSADEAENDDSSGPRSGTGVDSSGTAPPQPLRNRIRETCEYCGLTVNGYSALLRHSKARHSNLPLPPKECKCLHCDRTFATRRSRHVHLMHCVHNPERIAGPRNTHPRRRGLFIPEPVRTPKGDRQETLGHLLFECADPRVIEFQRRLGRPTKEEAWSVIHSATLLENLGELFRVDFR